MLVYSPAPGEYHPAIFKDTDLKVSMKVKKLDKDKKEILEDGKPVYEMKEIIIPTIEPIPENLKQWHVLSQQRVKQRYMHQSMWDRYYPVFVMLIMAFAIMFVVYSLFNAMDPVVTEFGRTADSFRSAAATNMEITEKLVDLLEEKQTVKTDLPVPPDVS